MKIISHPSDVESISSEAIRSSILLVKDFAQPGWEEEKLLRLARAMGTISSHGIGPKSNAEHGYIHRVEPLPEPHYDPYGHEVRSTTSKSMGCHTDDYFSEHPVDTVILYCYTSCPSCDSILITRNQLESHLNASQIKTLEEKQFPAPFGLTSIFGDGINAPRIRFGYYEIQKLIATGSHISQDALQAVIELEEIANSAGIRLNLKTGDCLILNNHEAIHGKTAVVTDSKRLLKRVRLHRNKVI